MIRVLHVIGAMNRAGAETMIMNIFRTIDRNKVSFDFLVHTENECDYDAEIQKLGGRIFRIPRFNGINYFSYKKACDDFFVAHPEIQIVHGHIGSSAFIYLNSARKSGKKTIEHSHSCTPVDSVEKMVFKILARPAVKYADIYFACSPDAAMDRFGRRIATSDKCTIVNNGIDLNLYKRDKQIVLKAKESCNQGDYPVFTHIGRFAEEKNHLFLLDVFSEILKLLPESKLMLVGRGPKEDEIKRKVNEMGIVDSVLFLGVRKDVPELLKASDVFMFPSIYEGLPVVLVEAQATGIPCLISDQIPHASVLTNKTVQLPINDKNLWAVTAADILKKNADDYTDGVLEVKQKGFDIADVSSMLERIYQQLINNDE